MERAECAAGTLRIVARDRVLREECVCPEGHAGALCDECTRGFAMHEGRCYPVACESPCFGGRGECALQQPAGEFRCACAQGYKGAQCQKCDKGFKMLDG